MTPRAKQAKRPPAAAPQARAAKARPAKSSREYKIHVVSHTHWDRAWYLPFEKFRLRLVEMIDDLLDLLETDKDYKSFFFDGQIAPIEDYLEIRPQRREQIVKLARAGRLRLGPHFILPDEFLVSGEALVRNLLVGTAVTSRYTKPERVGYIPDPFGHVSQIPQILNGFGIDSFVFMRGNTEASWALGPEFLWKGADGESSVLAVHQVGGYGNFMSAGHANYDLLFQPYEPERAIERADRLFERMKEMCGGDVFLFNNGHDHQRAQRSLARAIRDVNKHAAGRYKLVHSSLAEFFRDARAAVGRFKPFTGELRGCIEHFLLSGVYSARLYLKQENARCQTMLERYVEPLSALAALEGETYPADPIFHAWRTLLLNHPHDDICGCSVDEVHRDMVIRFAHVVQMSEWLQDRALDRLLFQVAMPPAEAGTPLMVFNPLAWTRSGAVRTFVDLPDASANPVERLELVNADGALVPASFAVVGDPFTSDWAWGDEPRRRLRVEFLARDVPAGGYEVFTVRRSMLSPSPASTPSNTAAICDNSRQMTAENPWIRLVGRSDGSLEIRDRETNRLLARTNLFEDCGDRGDEYDFDPVPDEIPIRSNGMGLSWSIVQRNPERIVARLEQEMFVPASLEQDRSRRSPINADIPLRTDITLHADSPRVDLRVTFVNHANDHRLRLGVEVPGKTDHVWVESKFDVLKRPIGAIAESNPSQRPMPTAPQNDWAAIETDMASAAVFNRGLPEYEAQATGESMIYWVTLVRAVGWLSRGDMNTRKHNAGPAIPTPEAQCRGECQAELSILPYQGGWQEADVPHRAAEYLTPLAAASFFHQHRAFTGTHDLPTRHSFFKVEPANVLMSAFKQAESGKGFIVRLWNPATRKRTARLTFDRAIQSARLARLDETPVKPLPLAAKGGQSVEVEIRPKQIVTLEVVPAARPAGASRT